MCVLVWPRSDLLFLGGRSPKKVNHFWAHKMYVRVCTSTKRQLSFHIRRAALNQPLIPSGIKKKKKKNFQRGEIVLYDKPRHNGVAEDFFLSPSLFSHDLVFLLRARLGRLRPPSQGKQEGGAKRGASRTGYTDTPKKKKKKIST